MVSGLLVWSRWVTLHSSWGSFAFHPNKRYARVVPGGIPVRRKGNSKSWTGCDILPTSRISKAVNWLIYYFLPIYSDNLAVECSSSRIAPLPCNSLRVIMCWWQLWVLDIKASVDRFSLIRICHFKSMSTTSCPFRQSSAHHRLLSPLLRGGRWCSISKSPTRHRTGWSTS